MIATIDKYFGGLKPNPDLPKLDLPKETPITAPVVREILGPDAESVALAWRFPGAADKDVETLQVVSQILYNGQAGLIDLDLTQQQKTLSAYCYPMTMSDYSAFMMQGRPKQGQTLDEVKDLLLGELKNSARVTLTKRCWKPTSTTSSCIRCNSWKTMMHVQICSLNHS